MKKKIKVVYDAPNGHHSIYTQLDQKIYQAMKSINAKWYAQGVNLEDGKRDICFDIEVDENIT